MSNFTAPNVPGWRFVLWGVIATLAGVGVGTYMHAPYLVIPMGLGGFLISGMFFLMQRAIRTGWAARNLRTLLVIFIIGQAILFIWRLVESRSK